MNNCEIPVAFSCLWLSNIYNDGECFKNVLLNLRAKKWKDSTALLLENKIWQHLWLHFLGKKPKMQSFVWAKQNSANKNNTMWPLDIGRQSLPEKPWPLRPPPVGLWDHPALWLNLLSASQPGTTNAAGHTRLSSEQKKAKVQWQHKDGMQVQNQHVSRPVTSTKRIYQLLLLWFSHLLLRLLTLVQSINFRFTSMSFFVPYYWQSLKFQSHGTTWKQYQEEKNSLNNFGREVWHLSYFSDVLVIPEV